MDFKKIHFAAKFPAQHILGLELVPVKKIKRRQATYSEVVPCEEAEAQGWAVFAIVPGEGKEWIADAQQKKDAQDFQTLIQDIWRAAKSTVNSPKLWTIQVEGEKIVVATIEDGISFTERLKSALSQHFDGEITHLSEPTENKHLQQVYTCIAREDQGEGELFNGEVILTPVPIYKSEG